MTRVNIYRVDAVAQAYAKEPSRNFKKLQARYKRITNSKRFTTAFPRYGTVTLTEARGGGSYADYGAREIRLGGNLSEAVLLHEIAHHVSRRHPQFGYCADHGHGFASALLAVVKIAQGAEAERALKHAYKALGIKVYKEGKPKGAAVRVQGEAPEKARSIIEGVIGRKKAAADNRAVIRKAMSAARADFDEQFVPCPEPGCYGDAKAQFTHWYSSGYRSNIGFEVQHEECGLHEYTKVRSDYWRERRNAVLRPAAHS